MKVYHRSSLFGCGNAVTMNRVTKLCRMLCFVLISISMASSELTIDMLPISRGMIIDAGSSGSRMHVYHWDSRIFDTLPPPISYPESKNSWTDKLEPGIATYSANPQDVGDHLKPLIKFAKDILKDYEDDWWKFPIYLKATGSLRMMSHSDREELLNEVRKYLTSDKCPFYFEFEFARVISGEEEGIYSWAAINFLKGNLLLDSAGAGTAESLTTVGALDLGRGSTQISFFKNDQDIISNLFKLQIGDQKHWNVYTHSFLYYGETTIQLRMYQTLVDQVNSFFYDSVSKNFFGQQEDSIITLTNLAIINKNASLSDFNTITTLSDFPLFMSLNLKKCDDDDDDCGRSIEYEPPEIIDACMPEGLTSDFYSPDGSPYTIVPNPSGSDFDACHAQILPLLHKERNTWCNAVTSNECSFDGVYQPSLPTNSNHEFYAFSGFRRAWSLMDLPEVVTLNEFTVQSRKLCSMSRDELKAENKRLGKPLDKEEYENVCFLATYCVTLLIDGYGFTLDSEVHFIKYYNGFKVGWALGSMLYEINALPWKYDPNTSNQDYKDFKDEHYDCCSQASNVQLYESSDEIQENYNERNVVLVSSLALLLAIVVFWVRRQARKIEKSCVQSRCSSCDVYGAVNA